MYGISVCSRNSVAFTALEAPILVHNATLEFSVADDVHITWRCLGAELLTLSNRIGDSVVFLCTGKPQKQMGAGPGQT